MELSIGRYCRTFQSNLNLKNLRNLYPTGRRKGYRKVEVPGHSSAALGTWRRTNGFKEDVFREVWRVTTENQFEESGFPHIRTSCRVLLRTHRPFTQVSVNLSLTPPGRLRFTSNLSPRFDEGTGPVEEWRNPPPVVFLPVRFRETNVVSRVVYLRRIRFPPWRH